MCLSKVYLARNGKKELLLEEVASLTVDGDKLIFKTLFSEQKEIRARIKEIDFMTHNLLLMNIKEGGVRCDSG